MIINIAKLKYVYSLESRYEFENSFIHGEMIHT